MDKRTTWIVVIVVLVVIIVLAALRMTNNPEPVSGQIVVGDEELVITPFEAGEDFVVDHVELATPSYLVVWAHDDRATRTEDDVLGVSELLPAGSHDTVRITRNARGAVHGGSSVVVTVHADDGDGVFETEEDPIATTEDGTELSAEVPVIEETEESTEDEESMEEESTTEEEPASTETTTPEEAPTSTDTTGTEDETTTTTEEDPADDTTAFPDARTLVITYTDTGFEPSTVTIKPGDAVEFVNKSAGLMWVASNEHPTHEELSEFDQGEDTGFNGVYDYTFETEGEWGFHNHRQPEDGGTVIVVSENETTTE